jgi:SAM-dependent methyltransferase
MMTVGKALKRLALNQVTVARALGEIELAQLRKTVIRDHRISSVLVAGGGRPHHGSESVFTELLEGSAKCLVVNIKHSAAPDVVADLACGWPFRDGIFDLIISTWVIEHVVNPQIFFREAFRLLKPNGAIVCAVPFIYRKHGSPVDYWRFTDTALLALARAAFFREAVARKVGGTPFITCVSILWPLFRIPFLGLLVFGMAWVLDWLVVWFSKKTGKGRELIDSYPIHYIIYAKK